MLGGVCFDRASSAGLLFVPLGEIRVHGTDAGQKTLLVVVRPRLHPFGEQLDAALEQAERTAVLLAQALHDRQQPVDGAVVGSEPVDQHGQEIAAFQFAPLAEPLQQVTDLRHDGRRVRVTGRRVGHHHGRRGWKFKLKINDSCCLPVVAASLPGRATTTSNY